MLKVELYDFQKEESAYLIQHKYAMLASDMGLGKSLTAIDAFERVGGKCLIVVPSFLKLNWKEEILDKVEGRVDRDVLIIKGRSIPPHFNLDLYKYILVSYETISYHEILFKWATTIICDEAHRFKNIGANCTRAAHTFISENLPQNLWLLSGTPIKNNVAEYYSTMMLCSYCPHGTNGKSLGDMSFYHFREKFMNRTEYRGLVEYSGIRNKEELKDLLVGKFIRHKAKDVLNLPEIVRKNIYMENESRSDLDLGKAWDIYTNKMGNVEEDIHFSTLKATAACAKVQFTFQYLQYLKHAGNLPVVVFSDHTSSLAELNTLLITDGFKTGVITGKTPMENRNELKNRFQGGKIEVILMSIKAGGVGFTLHAARNVVFNDLSFVPADNLQAEKRIHRIGQKGSCVSHRIIGGKMDKKITKILTEKMLVLRELL